MKYNKKYVNLNLSEDLILRLKNIAKQNNEYLGKTAEEILEIGLKYYNQAKPFYTLEQFIKDYNEELNNKY